MNDRKARERAFHNTRFARDGEFQRPSDRFYKIAYQSYYAFHERLLRDCAGKRVLEIGCGEGDHSLTLARAGAVATGIDISDVAVEKATRAARTSSLDNVTFLRMDAEAMDFPDETFDLIYGGGILHHLTLESVLPEIARLLTPGGRAVFSEPLGHNPFINLYRRMTPSQRTLDEHPLTTADLKSLRRYFGRIELEYFYLSTLLAAPIATRAGIRPVVDALNAVDTRLFALLPPLRKYAWTVILDLYEPLAPSGILKRAR